MSFFNSLSLILTTLIIQWAEVQAWETRQRKWDAGDANPYRAQVKRTYSLILTLCFN
jgi:hypothetical protein